MEEEGFVETERGGRERGEGRRGGGSASREDGEGETRGRRGQGDGESPLRHCCFCSFLGAALG